MEANPNPQNQQSSYELKYPDLRPCVFASMSPEDYIKDRVNDQLRFYDRKAAYYKKWFLFMRAATVIGGAIVPVLVNLDFRSINLNLYFFKPAINTVKVSTTLISLMVVLFVSLESVYHFKEQWKNYRSTAELLKKEYYLFAAGKGRYAGKPVEEAFKLFVEQCETAIDVENASTLQVMTTVSDTKKADVV